MSPLLLIGLIVLLAIVLFAVEVFLTPGTGVAGIGAVICVITANVLIYFNYNAFTATATFLLSTALTLLLLWWLSKSKTIEKMALKAHVEGSNATTSQLSIKVGDTGHALTRLALIGNALIDGKVVEVKSAGAFLDEGTPLRVIAVSEASIVVEKQG